VSLALEADANLNASLRYLDLRQRGFTGSELERIAASDHRVAVLEPDEAAIHLAACQDEAALAFGPAGPSDRCTSGSPRGSLTKI
jgi:hypothetical protein